MFGWAEPTPASGYRWPGWTIFFISVCAFIYLCMQASISILYISMHIATGACACSIPTCLQGFTAVLDIKERIADPM